MAKPFYNFEGNNNELTLRKRALIIFRRFVLGLVLCFLIGPFQAQNQRFKQFTSTNGLLSDKVYNLHQDRDGFLWVFSEFGTLKYDGEHFKQVLKNLPLSEAFIYCIYERPDGRKWIANSNANIYEVVNDSAKIVVGISGLSLSLKKSVSEIVKIIVDKNQNIFFATKHFSFKLVFKNGKYSPENLSHEVVGDSTRLKVYTINNELLPVFKRSRDDEFYSQNVEKQKYLTFDNVNRKIKLNYDSYTEPFRHFRSRGNKIYYTKADKLGRINEDNTVSEITFNFPVLNFKIDASDHIWVGCLNGGLFELNQNDSIIARYLKGTTVNDIAIDFQNGVWASTAGSGLFRFPNADLDEFRPAIGASSLMFAEKIEGGLILANANGEVYFKDHEGVKLLKGENAHGLVSALMQDGKIYLGLPHSVYQFEKKKDDYLFSTYSKKSAKFFKLYSIASDTILGVWRRGLAYITKGVQYKQIDFGEKINCTVLHHDTIWYGTENGLHFYILERNGKSKNIGFESIADVEKPRTISLLLPFLTKPICTLQIDEKGRIWFAVKGEGLYMLQMNMLHKFLVPPVEIINSIEANSNQIILSTNRGGYTAVYGEKGIGITKWIKVYSGEIQKAIRYNNKIYFETDNNLVPMQLSSTDNRSNSLVFRFVNIQADSVYIAKSLPIQLKHRLNNLSFNFDRISFENILPDLEFRLSGPITQTGKSITSSIVFSRLLPGRYQLEVYPDLLQGETMKLVIPFEILPEWYETWWAIFLFALLIIGVFVLSFNYNSKRTKKKVEEKNMHEQSLLEYKLIALKAQVNPHFISNCLTAVQNLISKGKTEAANDYVAQFGLLVRKILDYSGKSLITLSEELEVVRLYIAMEEVRYGKHFEFEIDLGSDIDVNDLMVPPLLLNPIVENAIWHGILPLENDAQPVIGIKAVFDQITLKIEISDNGVGLKKTKKEENGRRSYGLEITEQRINNINYLLKSENGKVEIRDLHSEDELKQGVVVTIWLPIENRYE